MIKPLYKVHNFIREMGSEAALLSDPGVMLNSFFLKQLVIAVFTKKKKKNHRIPGNSTFFM